jgi:hypothetical protein
MRADMVFGSSFMKSGLPHSSPLFLFMAADAMSAIPRRAQRHRLGRMESV